MDEYLPLNLALSDIKRKLLSDNQVIIKAPFQKAVEDYLARNNIAYMISAVSMDNSRILIATGDVTA